MGSIDEYKPPILIHRFHIDELITNCQQGDLARVMEQTSPQKVTFVLNMLRRPFGQADIVNGRAYILYSKPTVEAANANQPKVVKYLAESFSSITVLTLFAQTGHLTTCALHSAASNGYINVMKAILSIGFPVDLKDYYGYTPLSRAIQQRKVESVRYLLSRRASANVLFSGRPSLLIACLSGKSRHPSPREMEILDCLLRNGLDLKLLAKKNINPIREIMQESGVAIEEELLHRLMRYDSKSIVTFFLEPTYPNSNLPLALVASARGWDIREVAGSRRCPPTAAADILASVAIHRILNPSESTTSTPAQCNFSPSSLGLDIDLLTKALRMLDKIGTHVQLRMDAQSKAKVSTKEALIKLSERVQASADPTELLELCIAMLKVVYGNEHVIVALGLQKASKMLFSIGKLQKAEEMAIKSLQILLRVIKEDPLSFQDTNLHKMTTTTSAFLQEFLKSCKDHSYIPKFSEIVALGIQMVNCTHRHHRQVYGTHALVNIEDVVAILQLWRDSTISSEFPPLEDMECFHNLFSTHSIIKLFYAHKIIPSNPTDLFHCIVPHVAALNTVDMMGQRPLHYCAAQEIPPHDFGFSPQMLFSYIPLLVNLGAHLDSVNANGKTAYEICTNLQCKDVLKQPLPSFLTCLASCAVVANRIDYHNIPYLPPKLKDFISLHDPQAPRAKFSHSLY